ncbi:MAG: glycosyl hydrolase family 18 [Roseburia sp.]|nr:glycosyl hydrolase family 18 [Roseburia sp.]
MKKKIIPVLAAIVLIIVVILFMLLGNLIDKYTPSEERQDLSEYYQMTSGDEVAIIVNQEVLDVYGKMIDGTVYLDFDTVHDKINDRFYWDSNENKLLYTTATDLICADAESTSYYVTKESRSLNHVVVKADAATAYIAIDFVKLYSDFDYQVYTEPNRVVLTTAWGDYTVASANKDTEIRYQGGIKSPILADIAKGTELTVLEPDETWTKVATADGILGYIKSKNLGSTSTKTLTSDYVEEEFTHIKRDFKINMGWHQVTNNSANNTIGDVLRRSKGLNVISPTWFYLNDNYGNVYSLASSDYVDYCHQNGVEVWALVSNLENPEVDTAEVLAYTSRRENLINNLISAAIQYNFDGINVDFESLDPNKVGESYIQFIRELSLKCANNGLVLSVDNYVPTDYTAFYDREEQALYADYIVVMAYDEHYAGSEEAGSVASIGFVQDGVTNTQKEVPSDQIILGMPFYSRVWSLTPITDNGTAADASDSEDSSVTYESCELDSYATSMKEVQNLIRANGAETVWLEEEGQNFVEYVNSGVTYRIWIEDATSLEKKLQVMQSNGLAGGAFWKLGLEDSAVWDTIIKYIN